MRFAAVDTRGPVPGVLDVAIAVVSDSASQTYDDWDEWRADMERYATDGYTMVTYHAERVVTALLYTHGEMVQADYRDDLYVCARWYYDADHDPMEIWDVQPLAGGLSLPALIRTTGQTPYSTPKRYSWEYRKRWERPCFEHREPRCPACWGVTDRAEWTCTEHGRPECDLCWRLQRAWAISEYMRRYAAMAADFHLPPKRTLGSMSSAVWRAIEHPQPIALPGRAMDDYARAGYHAGRTECFKLGSCGPVMYGDVSQMYAAVLRDIRLPAPSDLRLRTYAVTWAAVRQLSGMVDATVTVPPMYAPPLGVARVEGYVFPVGTFRGHWTVAELRMAEEYGVEIDTVHGALYGEATLTPFSGYASVLIDWRERLRKSHDALEVAVKGLANALYGTIGMRAWVQTESVMPMPPDSTLADWPYHDVKRTTDGLLMRRADFRYRRPRWCNPLWAAMITAEARMRLYRLLILHGSELVYCDTDSIITMGELRGTADGPGGLRYEGFYQDSCILAPKLYRLQSPLIGSRMAHAGIPQWQMDRLITEGRARAGGEVGLMGSFHTGLAADRWVTYTVDRQYSAGKRVVLDPAALHRDDGWSDTRPMTLLPEYVE